MPKEFREFTVRDADLLAEERTRREHAEVERDDFRRQLAAVNSPDDDVEELVEWAEEERSLQRQRERRNGSARNART